MKSRMIVCFSAFVLLVSFLSVGCATKPVEYSFSPTEDYTSTLTFKSGNPGVSFVSFNGQPLPKPDKKTHWEPITFPSGIELRIIVHASYRTNSKTTHRGSG